MSKSFKTLKNISSGITAEVEEIRGDEIFGRLKSTSWTHDCVWSLKTGEALRFPKIPSENPVRSGGNPHWDIEPSQLPEIVSAFTVAFDPTKPTMLSDGRKVHIVSTDYRPLNSTKPQVAFQLPGNLTVWSADAQSGTWLQSTGYRLVNSQTVDFRLEANGDTNRLKPNIRATFDAKGTLVTVEKIK